MTPGGRDEYTHSKVKRKMEVSYACTRTHGATERRAGSLGTFLADGHGDHNRALQLANGAGHDRDRHQWSLDALYQHRLWCLDCHHLSPGGMYGCWDRHLPDEL